MPAERYRNIVMFLPATTIHSDRDYDTWFDRETWLHMLIYILGSYKNKGILGGTRVFREGGLVKTLGPGRRELVEPFTLVRQVVPLHLTP